MFSLHQIRISCHSLFFFGGGGGWCYFFGGGGLVLFFFRFCFGVGWGVTFEQFEHAKVKPPGFVNVSFLLRSKND